MAKTYQEYEDLNEMAFDELAQSVKYYTERASEEFHADGGTNSQKGAYYLIVAERFFNEMKIRIVTTAM